MFFSSKCHIFYHIRGENIFLAKYLRFYTIQSHLNQKWPKTKQLLLKMFLTSNCSLWLHSAVRVNYLIWFDQIRMGWKGLDLATLYFINRFKNLNENPPTPLASSTVSMAVKGLGLVLPSQVPRPTLLLSQSENQTRSYPSAPSYITRLSAPLYFHPSLLFLKIFPRSGFLTVVIEWSAAVISRAIVF